MGIKQAILRQLRRCGLGYRLYPWNTPASKMTQNEAFLLSNGPGDPQQIPMSVIETIQALIQTGKPILGICFGLQLIARAYGIATYKLPYGHRGSNHPVRCLDKSFGRHKGASTDADGALTSQNHGFAVHRKSVEAHPELVLTHEHIHDHTVAGLRVKTKPVLAVQYHPEAAPGPHDTYAIFDAFAAMIPKHVRT